MISLSILDNQKLIKNYKSDKNLKNNLDKFILSVSENGYGKEHHILNTSTNEEEKELWAL